MFSLFGAVTSVMDSVRDAVDKVFVELADLWFWPIIMLGIMFLAILVVSLLVSFSYEKRILKSVNKLNSYFLSKPFITEENLVEFNLKMKKVPKVLRNNWQIYMLNREDEPTKYININTCVDKPLRTSSIEKNIDNFTVFTILLVIIAFITGLKYASDIIPSLASTTGSVLFFAGLVPLGLVVMYTVFILIVKFRKNEIYSDLYDTFPLYERNLTKAVSTLPSYVDYEILFTKKEIKSGIPILQQYLEKRALIEQQELEKARANSAAVEEYDFSELGIDGSLVLERAMKESETFIRTRNRLMEECGQIEVEKENYKKTFEETEKDFQRKLQASRENLESLKSQQEASTNRIESNYIRKQQADEIKKQQQLEKDNEEANAKFNEEQISLQQEIDKRQQEIEEKKSFVQQAMTLEFKHYANTLYKALTQRATEIGNQKIISLAQENTDLKALLTDMQGVGADVNALDPQEKLIQTEEVTSENLYDMSKSDEEQIKENREASEIMSKEEEEKTKEHEKAKKEKASKEAGQETPQETTDNVSEAQSQENAENADGVVDENATEQPQDNVVVENANDANNTDADNDGTAGTDGTLNDATTNDDATNSGTIAGDDTAGDVSGDGGQTMDATSDADLNEIQRQIEQENANLQMQKQELENNINDTISMMDNGATPQPEQNFEPEVVAQPQPEPTYEQPQPQMQPQPSEMAYQNPGDVQMQNGGQPFDNQAYAQQPAQQTTYEQAPMGQDPNMMQQQAYQNVPPQQYAQPQPQYVAPEQMTQPAPQYAQQPQPQVAPQPQGRVARATRGSQRQAVQSRASGRRSNAMSAASELDALNAEMQKLLDTTNN